MRNPTVATLPLSLTKKLDAIAKQNERSRAAELRVAVKAHIAKNGK